MFFGEKIVVVWIVFSLLAVVRQGFRANVTPERGGSVKNRWNAAEYCCIFWKTKACWKMLEKEKPLSCSAPFSLEPVSCYSKEPDFDSYGCKEKYKGPEYAKSCEEGDKWPECVMQDLRVNPGHKLSLAMHVLALVLVLKGNSFWAFLLITCLTLI